MLYLAIIVGLIGISLAACPAKWQHHGSSCYLLSTDELDWTTARDICQEYEGGYLAELETKDESDYIETFAKQIGKNFWLGGRDEVEGHWKWVTSGKNFTYTDWHPGEPNDLNHDEDCLHLYGPHGYQWNDFRCSALQNYICEAGFKSEGPLNPDIGSAQPGAPRILELEDMLENGYKKFGKDFGHSTAFSLHEALWTCQNMFSNSTQKVGSKRILLFTNNDNPHAGSPQLQRQARTKASDLNETGIDLELMHLIQEGETFDVTKFYKDLLYSADDEITELPDPAEKLEELMSRVRTKDHKKRALRRIPFSLGKGLNLGVGVYTLVRSCPKPYGVKLSRNTNEELKTHSKTYLEDTGEVLMPQDLKKAQTYGGRRICFENDEVTEIKRFEEPGFYLMGFKPRASLKKYYHVKPGQFIYPDENTVSGSTTLFSALLKKCLDRGVMPICKYIPGKNFPPRFAALLPQEEELDEHKVQVTPPGFHVIILPYADDFRKVKLDETVRANTEQIDKAKDMIKKLAFTFNSESFENPVLQKYWRNIEALALDRDEPEEMVDYTMPNDAGMTKRAGKLIEEFKDLVFPAGYEPGKKRKAGAAADPAAKKAKTDGALAMLDAKTEAENGRLGKLTVAVLQEVCKKQGITPASKKKADLIEAINDHFGV